MSTKDVSTTASLGAVPYVPSSPYTPRYNTVNFAVTTIGASGADTVHVMPLAAGEYVKDAYLKITGAGNASTTIKLTDSRNSGAILAASAADAAAGTVYQSAGAGLGGYSNTAGYLDLTTVAAFALNQGSCSVFAVIGTTPF